MQSVKIAGREFGALLKDPFVRVAALVIILVPLLYGALYLWAFWDPYSRLDRIPVAVVNLDRPADADGTTIDAGGDLVDELRERGTFKWDVVSARTAREGLESGTYYMALTIPADFSTALATADSKHPVEAHLKLTEHESANMLASQIGGRVFTEIRAAASASASKGYYDNILVGFGELHDSLDKAASGAGELHGGLVRARSGAGDLASGSSRARSGSADLSDGLSRLASGAEKVDGGAREVASGAGRLAGGLQGARSGSLRLTEGTRSLASGANALAVGTTRVSDGAAGLSTAASKLAAGADTLDAGLSSAAPKLTAAANGATGVAAGTSGVVAALEAYLGSHPEAADDPAFAQALGAARQTKTGAGELAAGLSDAGSSLGALVDGAHSLSKGAGQLADGSKQLASGAEQSAQGAARLADAGGQVAAGTSLLADGVVAASRGAGALASGTSELSAGTSNLAAGASDAAAGSATLASGLARLDDGTHELASGLAPAVTGSSELSSGLTAGLESVPAFSARERASNAKMMSDPVALDTTRMGEVKTYGTGFSPYFIPLALWVGAVMIFFIVPPLSPKALSDGVPAPVAALASYWPAALLGVVQTIVMLLVLRFGLGLDPQNVPALFLFAILTSLVFVAILQWLSGSFGLAGKFIAIVLLMLQLTSAAGTFPIETLPGFFRGISPLLPMTYVVAGLRQIISGGDLAAAWRDGFILSAYGIAAVLLSFVTVRLRRAGKLSLATREV